MLTGNEYSVVAGPTGQTSIAGPRKGRKSLVVSVRQSNGTLAPVALSCRRNQPANSRIDAPVTGQYPLILTYEMCGSWLEQEIFANIPAAGEATVIEVYET